ncbi:MAG: hypothetical protein JW940_38330, partial [Polyangiaceae bacterium]|nr:hypothetical protein [Polyangiaceae bacterium]
MTQLSDSESTSRDRTPRARHRRWLWQSLTGAALSVSTLAFPSPAWALCEVAPNGGAVFMRSDQIEVGVNVNGAFGSAVDAPLGWHSRSDPGDAEIGFVSDPEDTAWSDYHGDFVTPGDPEEGWALEVDGNIANNNRYDVTELLGSLGTPECVPVSACGAAGEAQVVWTATDPFQGVLVSHKYTVVEGDTFVKVEVSLTNTTAVLLTDVYYMRNVDPDNDFTRHGDPFTTNTILSQPDGLISVAHVSATQDIAGIQSTISLVADDPRARVAWGGFSNRVPHDVWTGTPELQQAGATTDDVAMAIAFRLDLPAASTRVLRYSYGLSDDATTALACVLDTDRDGVADVDDADPSDPTRCADTDSDGCDDCTNTGADHSSGDVANDGDDFDADGLCDDGDSDKDNDGVPDVEDTEPLDASVCADADEDGCDDCAVTGPLGLGANVANDGDDFDADGLCDDGDPDDDNDGVL